MISAPSAKKEIPFAERSVVIVTDMTFSPSFTKTSAL